MAGEPSASPPPTLGVTPPQSGVTPPQSGVTLPGRVTAVKVVGKPRLKGTAKAGRSLGVKRGLYRPAKVTVKYRWYLRKKNGRVVAVKGATAAKLKLKKSWTGGKVRVKVTVSRTGHRSAVLTTGWSKKISR